MKWKILGGLQGIQPVLCSIPTDLFGLFSLFQLKNKVWLGYLDSWIHSGLIIILILDGVPHILEIYTSFKNLET